MSEGQVTKRPSLLAGLALWAVVGVTAWLWFGRDTGPKSVADLSSDIVKVEVIPHGVMGPTQYVHLKPVTRVDPEEWFLYMVRQAQMVAWAYALEYPAIPDSLLFTARIPLKGGGDTEQAMRASITADALRKIDWSRGIEPEDFMNLLKLEPQGRFGLELLRAYCADPARKDRSSVACEQAN